MDSGNRFINTMAVTQKNHQPSPAQFPADFILPSSGNASSEVGLLLLYLKNELLIFN